MAFQMNIEDRLPEKFTVWTRRVHQYFDNESDAGKRRTLLYFMDYIYQTEYGHKWVWKLDRAIHDGFSHYFKEFIKYWNELVWRGNTSARLYLEKKEGEDRVYTLSIKRNGHLVMGEGGPASRDFKLGDRDLETLMTNFYTFGYGPAGKMIQSV